MPFAPRRHRPRPKPRDNRLSPALRGYDRAWQRLRMVHLHANPLCVLCEEKGLVVLAEQVDHVKPFDGLNDPLRLDPANLQSLCAPCHSRKTALEDGGFGH